MNEGPGINCVGQPHIMIRLHACDTVSSVTGIERNRFGHLGKFLISVYFKDFCSDFSKIFPTHLLLISVMAGLNKTRKLSNGQVRNQEKYLNGWQKSQKT